MVTMKVVTYNMHGFQAGFSCLADMCNSGDTYIGCIAYADDIILLSASLVNVQNNA